MKRFLQKSCLALLRPVARIARNALTPEERPLTFDWHEIKGGNAQNCSLLLPVERPITESICSGKYEQEIMRFVENLVDPEMCCYDIGGHYGYYSVTLASLATGGSVHTFEPVASHANRIQQAISKSKLNHTQVHQLAVAGECGELELKFAGENGDDSMAYLTTYGGVDTSAAHEHYQSFHQTTVKTITLDKAAEQYGKPQFIKIDAEGAEGPILEGARSLIHSERPRLLIEVHGIQETMHCAEVLHDLDYQAVLLTKQKTTLPILWVHRSDTEALRIVENVLETPPNIFFKG